MTRSKQTKSKAAGEASSPSLPSIAIGLLVQHVLLGVGLWLSQLPYLTVVLMLATEILLCALITVCLYPHISVLKHLFEMGKFILFLAVLLTILRWGYNAALRDTNASAIVTSWIGLIEQLSIKQWLFALGMMVINLAYLCYSSFNHPEPRVAWVKLSLLEATVKVLGLMVLALLGLFLARFAVSASQPTGVGVSVDGLMLGSYVLIHFGFAAIATQLNSDDHKDIARSPYAN